MATTEVPRDDRPAGEPSGEDRSAADEGEGRLVFDLRRGPRRPADRTRLDRGLRVFLWTVVVILALFPVPWWWFW